MFTSQHDKAAAVCDDVAYTQRNFKHGEECIFDKRMATKQPTIIKLIIIIDII